MLNHTLNSPAPLASLRHRIRQYTRLDEEHCVNALLAQDQLSKPVRQQIQQHAQDWINQCRDHVQQQPLLDAFLQEFGLKNHEGLALMGLAEALLRIPDTATADRLIHEKILTGNWHRHQGHSTSSLVNASTWGLIVSERIERREESFRENDPSSSSSWITKLSLKLGEGMTHKAIKHRLGLGME